MNELYLAVIKGSEDDVRSVLKGVSKRELNEPVFGKKWSALTVAIRTNRMEIAQVLIDHGADVDSCASPDSDGFLGSTPPLLIASSDGRVDVVEFLLRNGADVNVKNNEGQNALMFCAAKYRDSLNRDVVDALLRAGINVHDKDANGNTALHYACKSESEEMVRLLAGDFNVSPWVANLAGVKPIDLASSDEIRQFFSGLVLDEIVGDFSDGACTKSPSFKSSPSPF